MKKQSIALALGLAVGAALAAEPTPAEGEVRRVNPAGQEITLKHGEIKNLDMPPMTMVFKVKDVTLLDKVQVKDKVRFTVDRINGAYIVLSIERAP